MVPSPCVSHPMGVLSTAQLPSFYLCFLKESRADASFVSHCAAVSRWSPSLSGPTLCFEGAISTFWRGTPEA
eukprot:6008809-Pyramimonas_sp.AAC.1